jgi:hypothetical protein
MSRATRLQVLDAPVDAVTIATETTATETRDSRSLELEDGGETRTGYSGESEITSLVPTPTIREPSATPGYSEWLRARGHAVTPTVETGVSDDVSTDDTGSTSRNPLYQFRLTDVAPVSNGYRGPNPLGHTGDSRDYFVVLDDEIAFDHKRKTAYNFLTYLAVEAGVRPVEHPNGSFSDAELLDVFIHAKRRGHLPDDAPAPLRVVKAAAFDLGIVTRDDLTEKTIHTSNGETTLNAALPDAAYNQTVTQFESEYRVSPGRDPITTQ